jgi:phage head maturation protease
VVVYFNCEEETIDEQNRTVKLPSNFTFQKDSQKISTYSSKKVKRFAVKYTLAEVSVIGFCNFPLTELKTKRNRATLHQNRKPRKWRNIFLL